MTSCLELFKAIDPEERRVLTFHMANGLPPGTSIVGTPAVEVTTDGLDPSPTARFSSAQVVGTDVLVTAYGCQPDNLYHIRIVAQASNSETIVMPGKLPCAVI